MFSKVLLSFILVFFFQAYLHASSFVPTSSRICCHLAQKFLCPVIPPKSGALLARSTNNQVFNLHYLANIKESYHEFRFQPPYDID